MIIYLYRKSHVCTYTSCSPSWLSLDRRPGRDRFAPNKTLMLSDNEAVGCGGATLALLILRNAARATSLSCSHHLATTELQPGNGFDLPPVILLTAGKRFPKTPVVPYHASPCAFVPGEIPSEWQPREATLEDN